MDLAGGLMDRDAPHILRLPDGRAMGSRPIELPGVGHFWVMEHVGDVLDALLALRPKAARG